MNSIQISQLDNVAVALAPLSAGQTILVGQAEVVLAEDVAQGHKFAVKPIAEGQAIIKYGYAVGVAKQDILPGQWVHTHNIRTGLSEQAEYAYEPAVPVVKKMPPMTFQGFLRPDGRAAIRNEIWIIPTVGCVNGIAQQLAKNNQHLVNGSLEGLYSFGHPFGCSQMGDDHAQTRKLLAALVNHPNAAGVLVLSLGCENLTQEQFKEELGSWNENRVKFLVCQQVEDELEAGSELLAQLANYAKTFQRQELPSSKLVVGMKCGGSDGLSGITANPTVGRFSDLLIAQGGSTVLTEVPEMFGAEAILMNRCVDQTVFDKTVQMVNDFKQYFVSHGQVVYENPSPGNKAGGISTLEDKSCGCVQKGGTAPVMDVLGYAEQVHTPGLNLLSGPGNDLVSATALTASGAHLILFTTGRGTPFGAPAPTVKIATNNRLAGTKSNWIDFNAGAVADGTPIDQVAQQLMEYILKVASGQQTSAERSGYREISIFKDGVVL